MNTKQLNFVNSSLLKETLKKYFPDMGDSEDEVEQAMIKILKNHPKEFGLNLRKIRTSVGLLQKTLCDALGVSQNTWSCWEKGTHSPRLANLDQISSYLKIDIGELFIGRSFKEYTYCKSIQDLYVLIVHFTTDSNLLDLNFGILDLFDYLKGAILHLRDKYTKKEYAVKIRNLNERKIDKSYSEIFINGKSLIWWFNNYEIFTDKWQPFGVIIDDPKDLPLIDESEK